MQREEKQLEVLLDAIMNRLNDIKLSITSMIHKMEMEYETISWPSFLDNFALISSHLTSLSKILAHEIGPPLRNLTVLPLVISPDRDEAIWQLTEGRMPVLSHDVVPNYLRTKPEPLAEQRILAHEQKANSLIAETAMKQVAQYNKVVSHVYDMINKAREEWDVESSSRSGVQQSSSLSDTQALVAAIGCGKGLKPMQPMGPGGPGGPNGPPPGMPTGSGMMVPPIRGKSMNSISPGGGGGGAGGAGTGAGGIGQMGKAPSAIKTNIKSANQIHPYR